MSRRFRRRPPPWLWLTLGIAAAMLGRWWLGPRYAAPAIAAGETAVLAIVDGRTLRLAAFHATEPPLEVRLLGIRITDDAAARDYLAKSVVGKTVRLELDKRRRASDGVGLAYVYLEGTFVNAEFIRRGWAEPEPYPGDSASHAKRILAAKDK